MLVATAVFDRGGILIGVEFKAEFAEETHNWHYEFLACYKAMIIFLIVQSDKLCVFIGPLVRLFSR